MNNWAQNFAFLKPYFNMKPIYCYQSIGITLLYIQKYRLHVPYYSDKHVIFMTCKSSICIFMFIEQYINPKPFEFFCSVINAVPIWTDIVIVEKQGFSSHDMCLINYILGRRDTTLKTSLIWPYSLVFLLLFSLIDLFYFRWCVIFVISPYITKHVFGIPTDRSKAVPLLQCFIITKTSLFKYIENFTSKNWKFSDT